ncbi:MAG: hypothetical protein ACRESO_05225, partial [Gammaproteobacteria bacterium]
PMPNREQLEYKTRKFFNLHWPVDAGKAPDWVHSYKLIGAIPDGDQGGCYALLKDNGICYVGSGTSRGSGIYINHGLGRRLIAHVLSQDKSVHAAISERKFKFRLKWQHCSSLSTIKFPPDYIYLAVALESYLIHELSPPPPDNVVGRTTVGKS